jgi:NRAMP (natural resistance-associated macrophage protein)-like metal ion transporter
MLLSASQAALMSAPKNIPAVLKRFWGILGPGLITGASDDDPSGIATYSQAGAQFGLATLWTALLTFPLMASIQEMCARIGLVTSQGLTGTLKRNYPRPVLYLMVIFSFPAIVLNIGADIAGMGAVAHLIVPGVHAIYFSIACTAILLAAIVYLPYQRMASVLKYLCAILLVYLVTPFFSRQNALEIIQRTFVPTIRFNREFINILVAVLGTTISPYLFFWQATMEVEEMKHHKKHLVVDKRIIHAMKVDVDIGMLFSNIVMFFIMLTTGSVLFNAGNHHIATVEQAAKALEPLAGKGAYFLFAIGVIGTGFLAIPVLSGSLSYIISETFDWNEGLDKKFHEARPFYIVIMVSLVVGLLINYVGISAIQALIYSAILYGLTSPVIIAIALHISNNKKVMGEYANGRMSNILGVTTLCLMASAALFLLYYQFVG